MPISNNALIKTDILEYATTYHKVKGGKLPKRILCSISCRSFLVRPLLISIAKTHLRRGQHLGMAQATTHHIDIRMSQVISDKSIANHLGIGIHEE